VLASVAACAFVLSFLCLTRKLTLVGSACIAFTGALALTGTIEPGTDWRYVWGLGLMALVVGALGAVLAYIDGDGLPDRDPAPA
jgi:hypothetical protein